MQKFVNLLSKDRSAQRNLVLLLALVCMGILFWHNIKLQQQRMKAVGERAELAARVTELDQQLKAREEQARKDEVIATQKNQPAPTSPNYALKGIYIQDNDKYSIINEEVYREGDHIDNLIVMEITSNQVVLQDPATGKKITMILEVEEPPMQ